MISVQDVQNVSGFPLLGLITEDLDLEGRISWVFLTGYGGACLPHNPVAPPVSPWAARPWAQGELVQHNREAALEDLRVRDARVCHVGVHPAAPVPPGARPCSPCDGLVVPHLLVAKGEVVHAALDSRPVVKQEDVMHEADFTGLESLWGKHQKALKKTYLVAKCEVFNAALGSRQDQA